MQVAPPAVDSATSDVAVQPEADAGTLPAGTHPLPVLPVIAEHCCDFGAPCRWDSAEADGDSAEAGRTELLAAVCSSAAAAGREGEDTSVHLKLWTASCCV